MKAASPRSDRDRSRHDYVRGEQDRKVEELRRVATTRNFEIEVLRPDAVLEEHDRVILWEVTEPSGRSCYRVLLGQGLVGFEGWCDRRSEGVFYRISTDEFDTEWGRFGIVAR